MTPVATARLSESALPAIGILTSVPQSAAASGAALLLVAHEEEHRRPVVGRAVVGGAGEMRADDRAPASAGASAANSARLARASGTAKIEPMVARTASTENGSTVSPTRIDARRADRVDGADDGAEIAGIAHRVERHPDVAGLRLDRRRPAVSRCSKTPTTICGLSRRVILASTVSLTSSTVPPRGVRGRREPRDQRLPGDAARVDQRADRPAGLERVDDELQPLGDEQPARLAVLLSASALMSLTSGLARLVISLTAPGARRPRRVTHGATSGRTARSTAPARRLLRG